MITSKLKNVGCFGSRPIMVALITMVASSALAIGYLQTCSSSNDGPSGSCGSLGGSCVVTTNPSGECSAGVYCSSYTNGVVTTTSQVGTCVPLTDGWVCGLKKPPVAGPSGKAPTYCN